MVKYNIIMIPWKIRDKYILSAPLEFIFAFLEKLEKLLFLENDVESTSWGGYDNKRQERLFRRDVGLKWPMGTLNYRIADDVSKLFTIWFIMLDYWLMLLVIICSYF